MFLSGNPSHLEFLSVVIGLVEGTMGKVEDERNGKSWEWKKERKREEKKIIKIKLILFQRHKFDGSDGDMY